LKVKTLDLSENEFTDASAKEFATYFVDNQSIQHLHLCNNSFTKEGLRKLKELIRHNSNVEMCERRMRSKETF
jgi:hypothetical protein